MASRAVVFISVLALLFAVAPVDSRLGMGATTLTTATFDNFVAKNGKFMVDFFDSRDLQWREGQQELEAAVRIVRDFGSTVPVAQVDVARDKELVAKYVPDSTFPQALWFLHGEATQYHRKLRTSKALSDFVMALDRDPVVIVQSEEEARNFVPSVFAKLSKGSPMMKAYEVVASKHMDTVAFTALEQSLKDSKSNSIAWLGNTSGEQTADPVSYSGEQTADALDRWVRLIQVMSEPVPVGELLEDEGSRVVVGKTFEEEIIREDKDVALLVYAPWCGFCKKFQPTWDSFAREVKEVPHLVAVKMDGSRNGSPLTEFSWDAYPSIFFIKAGEKKPKTFHGNRTLEALLQFVEQHGSKPLNLKGEDVSTSTSDL